MKKFLTAGSLILSSFIYAAYQGFGLFTNEQTAAIDGTRVGVADVQSDVAVGNTSGTVAKNAQSPSSGMMGQNGAGMGSGMMGKYRNGVYTGGAVSALYGNVQVEATVTNGALSDVTFLQYPSDRSTSQSINKRAMAALRSEAIAAQSAQVDTVSGATETTGAFIESLASALAQAQ